MHIILDSNVYASDYRMTGVSFRTLFDYLRRTESKLVLLRLIREEVVNDYARTLREEVERFAKARARFNRFHLEDPQTAFDNKPDVDERKKKLRQLLMKPASDIKPIYVSEVTGVAIDEVFMRGVQRKRPASANGEELRDAVIWLWAIQHSLACGTEVAFISNDSVFWDTDGVHPQLQTEIVKKGAQLALYRSIDDFIKVHAPATVEATNDWVKSHLKIDALMPSFVERAEKELAQSSTASFRDTLNKHCSC